MPAVTERDLFLRALQRRARVGGGRLEPHGSSSSSGSSGSTGATSQVRTSRRVSIQAEADDLHRLRDRAALVQQVDLVALGGLRDFREAHVDQHGIEVELVAGRADDCLGRAPTDAHRPSIGTTRAPDRIQSEVRILELSVDP
ncbi:hypothetical protein DHODJN_00640 [Methylorubrum extorquens]